MAGFSLRRAFARHFAADRHIPRPSLATAQACPLISPELIETPAPQPPLFHVRIRSSKYSPMTENTTSGDHAASAGPSWFNSPIFWKSGSIPR